MTDSLRSPWLGMDHRRHQGALRTAVRTISRHQERAYRSRARGRISAAERDRRVAAWAKRCGPWWDTLRNKPGWRVGTRHGTFFDCTGYVYD